MKMIRCSSLMDYYYLLIWIDYLMQVILVLMIMASFFISQNIVNYWNKWLFLPIVNFEN